MLKLFPLLLCIALVFNLLVPSHTDWLFFSLSFDSSESFFLLKNEFSEQGFGKTWAHPSPLSSTLVHTLYFQFGENGLGFLNIALFLSIAFLLNCIVWIRARDVHGEGLVSLVCIFLLLALGSMLYGLDIRPLTLSIFFLLLLIFLLTAQVVEHVLARKLLILLLSGVSIFFDIRAVSLFPFLLLLKETGLIKLTVKRGELYVFFGLIGVFLVSPWARESLHGFIRSIYFVASTQDPSLLSGSIYAGLYKGFWGFNSAFFVLLLSLCVWPLELKKRILYFVIIAGVWWLFSLDVLLRVYLVVFVLLMAISRCLKNPDGYSRHVESLSLLEQFLTRFSLSSRVFILLAYTFVCLVSFMRYPLSDAFLYERGLAEKIDILLEDGNCISEHAPQVGGYIAFRYSFTEKCRPRTTLYSLGLPSKNDIP